MEHGPMHALLFQPLLVYMKHVIELLFSFRSNKMHLIHTCIKALCTLFVSEYTGIDIKLFI